MSKVKREFSAGGIVYKKEKNTVLWLVIQPEGGGHWSKNRWQFPKGLIEEEEKTPQAARREVEEETGVKARVVEKAATFRIFFYDEEKNKVAKTITLFLMVYQSEVRAKKDVEEIAGMVWLPYRKARQRLTFANERKALERAEKILLEKEKQGSLF